MWEREGQRGRGGEGRERKEGRGVEEGKDPSEPSGMCTGLGPCPRKMAGFLSHGICFPKENLVRFHMIFGFVSIFQSFIADHSCTL